VRYQVKIGMMGRKSGKGFFLYNNPKSKEVNPEAEELLKKYRGRCQLAST